MLERALQLGPSFSSETWFLHLLCCNKAEHLSQSLRNLMHIFFWLFKHEELCKWQKWLPSQYWTSRRFQVHLKCWSWLSVNITKEIKCLLFFLCKISEQYSLGKILIVCAFLPLKQTDKQKSRCLNKTQNWALSEDRHAAPFQKFILFEPSLLISSVKLHNGVNAEVKSSQFYL